MTRELKQARRGLGTLYKRDASGSYLSAHSRKQGVFWLEWVESGKRHRLRLEVDGRPVTDYSVAVKERERVRMPAVVDGRAAMLRRVREEIERLEGVRDGLLKNSIRIGEMFEAYKSAVELPSVSTLDNYRFYWNRFTRYAKAVGVESAGEVTGEVAAGFMSTLQGESGGTYNIYLQFLRMIFKRVAGMNPFVGVQRKKAAPMTRRCLTDDELKRVVDNADGELRRLLLLGIYTGARMVDCCLLDWSCVSLGNGVVTFTPRKTAHSSGAVVSIGISGELRGELERTPEGERRGAVCPLFAEMYQKSRKRIIYILNKHFRKCGLETNAERVNGVKRACVVGFHSLRHTFVTKLAEAGVSPLLIQKFAGHSNMTMTAHYAHIGAKTAETMAHSIDFRNAVPPSLTGSAQKRAQSAGNSAPLVSDGERTKTGAERGKLRPAGLGMRRCLGMRRGVGMRRGLGM